MIEELRALATRDTSYEVWFDSEDSKLCRNAADEIERLRALLLEADNMLVGYNQLVGEIETAMDTPAKEIYDFIGKIRTARSAGDRQ